MGVSPDGTEYSARNPPGPRVNLKHVVLGFVALAAVAGWAASFIGLHNFGAERMEGYTDRTAWLIPAAFDGAAFACAVLTYRASIAGRSSLRGRLLTWAFTALSSWINYIDQPANTHARMVAVWLPIAAVAVFDVVLSEMRADWEEAHGRKAFRMRIWLLALRAVVDRQGTRAAFREQITDIPVSSLVGLGADLREPARAVQAAPQPVTAPADEPADEPQPVVVDVRPETVVDEPLPAADDDEPPARPDGPQTPPDNVVPFMDERPDWLTDDMTAKQAMFAYLDRHPQAKGPELDRFGMRHLDTKKDYGRRCRVLWERQRGARAVNEG